MIEGYQLGSETWSSWHLPITGSTERVCCVALRVVELRLVKKCKKTFWHQGWEKPDALLVRLVTGWANRAANDIYTIAVSGIIEGENQLPKPQHGIKRHASARSVSVWWWLRRKDVVWRAIRNSLIHFRDAKTPPPQSDGHDAAPIDLISVRRRVSLRSASCSPTTTQLHNHAPTIPTTDHDPLSTTRSDATASYGELLGGGPTYNVRAHIQNHA